MFVDGLLALIWLIQKLRIMDNQLPIDNLSFSLARDNEQRQNFLSKDQQLIVFSATANKHVDSHFPKFCLQALLLFAVIMMILYSSLHELSRSNRANNQDMEAKILKIKDRVENERLELELAINEIHRMSDAFTKEIKLVEQQMTEKAERIENQLQRKISREQDMVNQQHKQINIKLESLISLEVFNQNLQKKPAELYSPTQLEEKKRFQKDMAVFLQAKNAEFETVKLHRFNFQLTEPQGEHEPHNHANVLLDYMTKEQELPFCIIMPRYLDIPNYMLQHSLNSVFRQNYSNYVLVIFNAENEKTNNFIDNYLLANKIPTQNYIFVRNFEKTSVLENIYMGVHSYCHAESIVMVLEGGSSLFTKEAIKTFNDAHLHALSAVVFSNHFKMSLADRFVNWGDTALPSASEVRTRSYREKPYYQLLSFRAVVFREIAIADLRDAAGRFLDAWAFPVVLPLLELSCGFVKRIAGLHAVEYINEQYWARVAREKEAFDGLRARQPYACSRRLEALKKEKVHDHPFLEHVAAPRRQSGGLRPVATSDPAALDPLRTNPEGQTIEDVLYQFSYQRVQRKIMHEMRINFIKDKTHLTGLNLIKHNLKLDRSMDQLQKTQQLAEYNRLANIYHFDRYKEQLPICILACSYNNNVNFRIQYNLNSIFRQNYSNYFAVIINDASNDGSDFTYRKYLNFHNIPTDKYAYIENHKHKTTMQNIYDAVFNVCSDDSIVLIVDGDDELIGKNVLKVFNANYQKLKGGYIYSNYFTYQLGKRVEQGFSHDHPIEQKQQLLFRDTKIRNSHTRTFKASLFKKVDKSNFLDQNGQFYTMTADLAIAIPVMEKACGRVYFIPEVNYLYNYMTGNNDWLNDLHLQQTIKDDIMKKKKKQECDPQYRNIPIYPQVA